MRKTIRDLGYSPGCFTPGPQNSLLDVPGLSVGQKTLRDDENHLHTGVTIVFPRGTTETRLKPCYAAIFSLNGAGEVTAAHFIADWGFTNSPIAFTDSMSVGVVMQTLTQHAWETAKALGEDPETAYAHYGFPVVGETWGGGVMDIYRSVLTPADVLDAIRDANAQTSIQEGNHGGGAPMLCLGHKGGTGTSSRLVPSADGGHYTIGVLAQTNFGNMAALQIGGVPIGRMLMKEGLAVKNSSGSTAPAHRRDGAEGSLLVLIVTDAPLLPHQLRRLAQRATFGLAAVGGKQTSHNTSGDIFIALSTGNCPEVVMKHEWKRPSAAEWVDMEGSQAEGVSGRSVRRLVETQTVQTVVHSSIDALFVATAEATEEAILNSMTAAEDMRAPDGTVWRALPLERVHDLLREHRPRVQAPE